MKFISHRGNIEGPDQNRENSIPYIENAISLGYDVEIDLRREGEKLFLGHDTCQYPVDQSFLEKNVSRLWIHAKDLNALKWLLESFIKFNFFWHEEDAFSVTSSGYIWTYPKKDLTRLSICVMPEYSDYSINEMRATSGVCSDRIAEYQLRLS